MVSPSGPPPALASSPKGRNVLRGHDPRLNLPRCHELATRSAALVFFLRKEPATSTLCRIFIALSFLSILLELFPLRIGRGCLQQLVGFRSSSSRWSPPQQVTRPFRCDLLLFPLSTIALPFRGRQVSACLLTCLINTLQILGPSPFLTGNTGCLSYTAPFLRVLFPFPCCFARRPLGSQ